MSIKPAFTELEIARQEGGFYKDNSLPIALISKGIINFTSLSLVFSSSS